MTTTTTPTTPLPSPSPSPSWEASAACATRLDLPWTRDTRDVSAWDAATMRTVCGTCPARAACADTATALDITGGWWAGTDRDPNAPTPGDLAPITWHPVTTTRRQTVPGVAQAALDLDHLEGLAA